MSISANTRQAYSEVDEFLGLITEKQLNKIPNKLRQLFKEEKDINYTKGINPNIPIKDQNLKEETLAIIALLNLQFWCEDENEKARLREVYAKNEERYKELLQVAFNPDKIFKSRQEVSKEKIEEQQVVPFKQSILKSILNKLKGLFKLK